MRLAVFSLLLASCAAVPRPNAELCIINAPNLTRHCYNISTDYTDDGAIKPGAAGVIKGNGSVTDLNKMMCVDSPTGPEDGIARVKQYIKLLREECKK